jgi:hypothetical protein
MNFCLKVGSLIPAGTSPPMLGLFFWGASVASPLSCRRAEGTRIFAQILPGASVCNQYKEANHDKHEQDVVSTNLWGRHARSSRASDRARA